MRGLVLGLVRPVRLVRFFRGGGSSLLLRHLLAHLVLEAAGLAAAEGALIEEGKGEVVAVGSLGVAAEGADTFHGAGFGAHVPIGRASAHTAAERAVLAGDGERGQEVVVDVLVLIGIAQEAEEEFGRGVVVEREAATVGKLIVGGVEAYEAHEALEAFGGAAAVGVGSAGLCANLIEHGFGVEVVALLHHAEEDLIDGVCASDEGGDGGSDASAEGVTFYHDAALGEEFGKMLGEGVFAVEEERREYGVIVVPAPAPAVLLGVFHREVEEDVSAQGVDALFAHGMDEGQQVVAAEERVETGAHVEIASEHAARDGAVHEQRGGIVVVHAELGECGDGSEEFLTRAGAHGLLFVVAKEGRIGREVIDIDAHLRALQEFVGEEAQQAFLQGARQQGFRCRVHLKRVDSQRVPLLRHGQQWEEEYEG